MSDGNKLPIFATGKVSDIFYNAFKGTLATVTVIECGACGRIHFCDPAVSEGEYEKGEFEKLEKSIGGIKDMGGLPDALFIVDVGFEKIAVCEANKLKIPVVGVVDTNNSPDNIDYIIPGNDDSMRAIELYVRAVADTIIDAKAGQQFENTAMQGKPEDTFVEVEISTFISDEE